MSEFLQNIKGYNPLPIFLFSRMVFYAWKNYTDCVLDKLIQINLKVDHLQNKDNEDNLSEYSEEDVVSQSSSEENQTEDDQEIILDPQNVLHCPSLNKII